MKIVATIARILLGAIFLVFGLDKFYAFIPAGPLPGGAAGQFVGALMSSHYIVAVGFFEAASGLLLLINRYVPLALTVLAAVITNILLTGILLERMGLPSGIVVAILWLIVFWRVRGSFAGIFEARAEG